MKKLAILVSVSSFLANPALSQVTVETGEHESFTRMAINVPVGTTWKISKSQLGYYVTLDEAKFDNLEGFFDIIPRDRIADVAIEEQGNRLSLTVNCECHYIDELWRPNWLLVDIHDGPSPSLPSAKGQQNQALVPNETNSDMDLEKFALPLTLNREAKVQFPRAAIVINSENLATQDDRQFERTIRDSLNRASSQGLINLSSPEIGRSLDTQVETNFEFGSESANPGLSAATALEEFQSVKKANVPPESDIECLENSRLDITSWAIGENFSKEIYEGREEIYGEFDIPNSEAIFNLARTYLYYGFGREAKQVLEIEDGSSSERNALYSIAEIIDGDQVSDGQFGDQLECESDISFWAFLAISKETSPNLFSVEDLVLTFRGLPNGLQVLLGPRFAGKLRGIGAYEIAATVLNPAVYGESRPIELSMASANVDIDRGNILEAIENLSSIARDDQRTTPAALLQLLAIAMDREVPIEDHILRLLDTMKFEFRNELIGKELNRAYLESLIHNGHYEISLTELFRVSEDLSVQDNSKILETIASGIVANAENEIFLDFAFSSDVFRTGAKNLKDYSARLLKLGFVERATALDRMTDQYTKPQSAEDVDRQITLVQQNLSGNQEIQSANSPDDETLFAASEQNVNEARDFDLSFDALSQAGELISTSRDLRATVVDLIERQGAEDQ